VLTHAREVVGQQEIAETGLKMHTLGGLGRPVAHKAVIETLLDFPIGVGEPKVVFAESIDFLLNRQTPRLKHQRLGRDVSDVEGAEEGGVGLQVAQLGQEDLPPGQQLEQKLMRMTGKRRDQSQRSAA